MIKGLGIDLVEVERIRRAMEKSPEFARKVFSPEEIAYCSGQGGSFESFAGRFAAKEAFFKALGTGWRGQLAFHEVSVRNDGLGMPFIVLTGDTLRFLEVKKNCKFHLSISHTRLYATAVVIIETTPDDENSGDRESLEGSN